ncbi:RICIN domain-containing protein [uncultured Aquimarina sp.]|uniref:RICIN domain-containing protein n=1 Tax=uncultured Aquimarina sp. TaxID=575652 RepID=UPI00262C3E1A|nr:RICIN domain-containing protein [uncultured Aquimarina sp.]
MKRLFYLKAFSLCLGLISTLSAQDLLKHDFNDGTLGPFETTNLNRMTFKDGALECTWKPSDYTGTGTSSKKTEFRAKDNAYVFKQEFWTGFWLKVHSNTLANNPNTEMSLMQTWGFREGAANHYFMLQYFGDGSLRWQHRYNMGQNFTRYVIYPDFPKDQFVKVVIHVKLKNVSDGIVQVWIDDELMLNKTGQTIGFGDQNENGQYNQSYSTPGSWGMYNYANEEYVSGETRTVTYDDVTLWNGPDGYDIVNPSDVTPPGCSLPWKDNNFTVSNETTNYSSGAIDISCASKVDISLNIKGEGNMEDSDYINVYYKVDGGAQKTIAKNVNAFALKTLSIANISGNKLELIIQAKTSYADEVYTVSNIKIAESDGGTTGGGSLVHIQKRNASDFAIDGNQGVADGQNVYLWSANPNNVNQQWIEIDRGNGYYSYQKVGTNHCIDGNHGGATRQNVYLWTCNENNQNQQWQKVNVGGGAFKLIKRNASGFALDGGSGGSDSQNIALWDSSSNSQNLHWIITPIESNKDPNVIDTNEVLIYPNPVADQFTISLGTNETSTYTISDMNGKTILKGVINEGSVSLDINGLAKGLYLLKVSNRSKVLTSKIIKQ